MPALRDTQQLLWSLITAPEGVGDGLRRIDMKPDALGRVVRGDERLDAIARLDIYANMYFWRLLDILRGDFPALVAALGDDHFHNLVTDYLCACPSQHPSVRNVGARLAGFVGTHPLAAERPWLAELARLERTRVELFDGADAEPLAIDQLRALTPEQFIALPLPLVPSHAFVEVAHAVDDVWRAAQQETPIEPPAAGARTLVVWRQELEIHHRPLDPLEHTALVRARDGAPFGVVCDLLAESLPVDEAGPAAFAMLARWVGDGIIARR
jgi:hypothetical protein